MRVILAMTRIAVRRCRDLGGILCDMAGVAIEAAVRAGQCIAGLGVVIEAPARPTTRIVTLRTVSA
jgi:hypothetical protein